MWNDGLDSVGVGSLDDGEGGSLSGVLHRSHLVGDRVERVWEEGNEVRLDSGRDGGMLSNSADGVKRPLASESILLVAELLLEQVENLGRGICLLDVAVYEGGEV